MFDPTVALRGIITVLNTPFTESDRIDVNGLAANVEFAIRTGVAGFLVPALASEVYKLTLAERALIVQVTSEVTRNRVPIIGSATASTAEERMAAAEKLMDLGCDGILVAIPYTNDSDYKRQVEALAQLSPPLLMLQDWDSTGYGLRVSLIRELFEQIPAFRAIKIEVNPAGVKYSEVLKATEGKLHVSGGWAVMQMIETLDRGVHAFMPTGLHPVYTRIYNLYIAGERQRACTLFRRLLPILAFSNQHLDISIHFFKRLVHRQGLYATPNVREPILPFDSHHEHMADELIDTALALMAECEQEE